MSDTQSSADRNEWEVEYEQFRPISKLRALKAIAGVLTWPLIWPLAMLARSSDPIFRTCSEALALLPYLLGVVVRAEFYRFALRRCGRNVVIEFGTVFIYRDIQVGDNVLIGRYNIVHHCDFDDYVLTAERCTFLSGSAYHRHDRTDVPMALQGGRKRRIRVGRDSWIGAHAVVMDDVGHGSIVGAGSVVTKPVDELTIAVGNPAQTLRRRAMDCQQDSDLNRNAE